MTSDNTDQKHPGELLHVLTWHVHGNYLYYLSQVPHIFYVLVDETRSACYSGLGGALPWGSNVVELPVSEVRHTRFDCILFQSLQAWKTDQHLLLSDEQKRLPAIYLEHDPPQEHPTNTRHPVDDPNVLLVHVTAFNQLMWERGCNRMRTRVIEHGVVVPEDVDYRGNLARGISVVNNLAKRGRRLGLDVFEDLRRQIPLDLVGMDAERCQGIGEVSNPQLPEFMAQYRFYFHPVRWTSLGLSVIEAMMVGLPVIGLATTELVTVIRNGESGYIDTDPQRLAVHMQRLIDDPDEARALGEMARRDARLRFDIGRFVQDWAATLSEVCQK